MIDKFEKQIDIKDISIKIQEIKKLLRICDQYTKGSFNDTQALFEITKLDIYDTYKLEDENLMLFMAIDSDLDDLNANIKAGNETEKDYYDYIDSCKKDMKEACEELIRTYTPILKELKNKYPEALPPIDESYKNAINYYKLIKKFLDKEISKEELQKLESEQKQNDMDANIKSGYFDAFANRELKGDKKKFEGKCINKLYTNRLCDSLADELVEYEKISRELDIKGVLFFEGLLNIIDFLINEKSLSEDVLREKLKAVYDTLTKNKNLWLELDDDLDENWIEYASSI